MARTKKSNFDKVMFYYDRLEEWQKFHVVACMIAMQVGGMRYVLENYRQETVQKLWPKHILEILRNENVRTSQSVNELNEILIEVTTRNWSHVRTNEFDVVKEV